MIRFNANQIKTSMSYVVSCDTDLNTEFWKHPNCTVEFDVIFTNLQNEHSVNLNTGQNKQCTDINFTKTSINNGLYFHRYIFDSLIKGTLGGWVGGWMEKRGIYSPSYFQHFFDFWQTLKSWEKKNLFKGKMLLKLVPFIYQPFKINATGLSCL